MWGKEKRGKYCTCLWRKTLPKSVLMLEECVTDRGGRNISGVVHLSCLLKRFVVTGCTAFCLGWVHFLRLPVWSLFCNGVFFPPHMFSLSSPSEKCRLPNKAHSFCAKATACEHSFVGALQHDVTFSLLLSCSCYSVHSVSVKLRHHVGSNSTGISTWCPCSHDLGWELNNFIIPATKHQLWI